MGFFRKIKRIIFKFDLFYTSELLRYKTEPEYRTVFGGVLSIMIILGLILLFYSKLIDTVSKIIITSDLSNINAADPTHFNISTFPQDKFMFGVEIWHHDLNVGKRYFDIVLTSIELDTGQARDSSLQYPLEQCTLDHWEGFPDVQKDYERLKMNYWLCLPRNMKYNIQGKYASVFSQTLQVAVKKCTNESDPSRECASVQQIDNFFEQQGQFYFTIYFINPLINPTSKDYLTFYLEDNNYIIFTKTIGAEGILFKEEYTIQTDHSIWPYPETQLQRGGLVSDFALKNPYEVENDVYCSFSFFKSGTNRFYQRKFQKLDEILSYIGGLFGTIAICLFLVKVYNGFSFEIALGAQILNSQNQKEDGSLKNYNFMRFLLHGFYKFIKLLGCSPNWKSYKKFDDCKEEMVRQLDVVYLIKRVMLLERALLTLLEEHQIKGLHLQRKPTLQEVKRNRNNFKMKRKLLSLQQKFDKKSNLKYLEKEKGEQSVFSHQKVFNSYGLQNCQELRNKNKIANLQSIINHYDQTKESDWAAEDQCISEDSSSSYESEEHNNEEMIEQLQKLQQEAKSGNKKSQKILSHLNKTTMKQIQKITITTNDLDQIKPFNRLGLEIQFNCDGQDSCVSLKPEKDQVQKPMGPSKRLRVKKNRIMNQIDNNINVHQFQNKTKQHFMVQTFSENH